MSDLFESIKQGLSEAIEYERGNLPDVRIDKLTISPIRTHSGEEIKNQEATQHDTEAICCSVGRDYRYGSFISFIPL